MEAHFSLQFSLMDKRNIVGARIRMARRSANPEITQLDLAARLQVQGLQIDRVTISKIETGLRAVTDIEAKAFAQVLGVSINWLYGENSKS
jgi:transcriptional regulator with XRE-family HTH domain